MITNPWIELGSAGVCGCRDGREYVEGCVGGGEV